MERKEDRLYLRFKTNGLAITNVDREDENSINSKFTYMYLDLIDNVDVEFSSRITEYSMLENDIISEHMYRQPGSITIRGKFSSAGKHAEQYGGNIKARLENIQRLFELLKDEKVFIDIISNFNIRENYLLQRISWTEKINSLEYTFTFKQVYLAKSSDLEIDVDLSDEHLPTITEPNMLDFTDEFLNKEEVFEIIIRVLNEIKAFDEHFLKHISIGVYTTVIGTSAIVGLISVAAVSATIPGVGWFVSAGLLLAVGVMSIFKAAEKSKQKLKIKQFRKYKDKKKTEAEEKRFFEFMENLNKQIDTIENFTKVYSIEGTGDAETIININGQYYSFLFTRNNSDNTYGLEVKDMQDITYHVSNKLMGLSSLDEAIESNNIFNNIEGSQVYIFNKNSISESVNEGSKSNNHKDLSQYMILVTDLRLNEWVELITEIVRNEVLI